jgi:hypothetical protein
MIGELTQWNPNLDPTNAARMINNRYRAIVCRRNWYGLKVRGIASTPATVNNGMVTVTQNSSTVTGDGTNNWDQSIVGLQFRSAMIYEWQTITAVSLPDPITNVQTITLDMPFTGPTATGGYQIAMVYLTFGNNINRFKWATNKFWGWRIRFDVVNIQTLNWRDTWRTMYGWTTDFVTRPPTPDGQFQVELWPPGYQYQEIPFEAYTQPPEMRLDTDSPVAWIRSDVIVTGALSDALLFRPKTNPYYSEALAMQIAAGKRAQYEADLLQAENADEALDQQAVQWDYEGQDDLWTPGIGSLWAQLHP